MRARTAAMPAYKSKWVMREVSMISNKTKAERAIERFDANYTPQTVQL